MRFVMMMAPSMMLMMRFTVGLMVVTNMMRLVAMVSISWRLVSFRMSNERFMSVILLMVSRFGGGSVVTAMRPVTFVMIVISRLCRCYVVSSVNSMTLCWDWHIFLSSMGHLMPCSHP